MDMETEITLRIPQAGMQEVYHHLKVFVRRKRTGKAVVTFDGKSAHFATPEMDIGAPAEGNWPGPARVGTAALMAIANNPPAQDPLLIRVADGYFYFGPTFSCQCTWRPSKEPLIRLPINYDDGTLMAVPIKYTAEDISTSGLTEHVNKARNRLQGRLKTAARALAPYHITEESLRAFVDKSITAAGVLNHICQIEPGNKPETPDLVVTLETEIKNLRSKLESEFKWEMEGDDPIDIRQIDPKAHDLLIELLSVLQRQVTEIHEQASSQEEWIEGLRNALAQNAAIEEIDQSRAQHP